MVRREKTLVLTRKEVNQLDSVALYQLCVRVGREREREREREGERERERKRERERDRERER